MPIEHDDLIGEVRGGPCVRVTTFEGSPESIDRALQWTLNHVLPTLRTQPGWQGALGLTSQDRRRGLALTFWESESALVDTGMTAVDSRNRAASIGISVTDIERFEIIFHERPGGAVE